ncbi:MAG: tetratricopeptide repeat protein [Spirochaetaceae bacterium]|jgi:tetratricopeptide (TPR) repeat protein|nr:tetratricopeptide repeat protein [Spirochaetaceae bacterium]
MKNRAKTIHQTAFFILVLFAGITISCATRTRTIPSDAAQYYNTGNQYLNTGDYDKAIENFSLAIKEYSKYTDAYIFRGGAYHQKGDYDAAIENYTKAIKIDKGNTLAYLNRAKCYLMKKEYEKAIKDTDAILSRNYYYTDYPGTYTTRGATYYEMKEYDKAIADTTKALKLDPKYSWAYNIRGLSYKSKEEYKKALDDFNKALEIYPAYADAIKNREDAYIDYGASSHSSHIYTEAIKLYPENAELYYRRGRLRDYLGATSDLTTAISLDPNNIDYYLTRATFYQSYYGNGSSAALADYATAIRLYLKIANPYIDSYISSSEKAQAIKDFSEAIKLEPDNVLFYECRAYFYENSDIVDAREKAIADYTMAIKLAPKKPNYYLSRANLYLDKKEYDNALTDLSEVIILQPDNANGYLARGQFYFDIKDYANALKDFDKAFSLRNILTDEVIRNRQIAYDQLHPEEAKERIAREKAEQKAVAKRKAASDKYFADHPFTGGEYCITDYDTRSFTFYKRVPMTTYRDEHGNISYSRDNIQVEDFEIIIKQTIKITYIFSIADNTYTKVESSSCFPSSVELSHVDRNLYINEKTISALKESLKVRTYNRTSSRTFKVDNNIIYLSEGISLRRMMNSSTLQGGGDYNPIYYTKVEPR